MYVPHCFPLHSQFLLSPFPLSCSLNDYTLEKTNQDMTSLIKLVHVDSWVYLNMPLSSTFPLLSWLSSYVFFNPYFTSHQLSHSRDLWAPLELKKITYQFMYSSLMVPCSLSPAFVNKFMVVLLSFPLAAHNFLVRSKQSQTFSTLTLSPPVLWLWCHFCSDWT